MEWNKLFRYDENGESCLVRVANRYSHGGRVRSYAGSKAGTLALNGYYTTHINGKSYLCHRIIMELHGEAMEGYFVDHVNGNRADNRYSNLKKVTQLANNRNVPARHNSESGMSGVKEVLINGRPQWTSYWIGADMKRKTKTFSIAKYGYNAAKSMATKCRTEGIAKANASGAGYSKRHGV